MPREFTLPDLGEGIAEAQVIRVLVKSGDRIEEDQYLMEVETDKAAVEIPSPYAGTIKSVHAKEGATINVGDVIVTFDDVAGASSSTDSSTAAASSSPAAASPVSASSSGVASAGSSPAVRSASVGAVGTAASALVDAPPSSAPRRTIAAAAPAVRKRARELHVDIDTIVGTGPGGRVTKVDVERAAAGAPASSGEIGSVPPTAARAATPPVAPPPGVAGTDKWGPIRREPINQIRKTIATQMTRSAFTAVHVTHCDEADITELERVRRRLNEVTGGDPKLTVMSFVIRAVCLSLKKYPIFNASFDMEGGEIIYKDYISMGIAVDSERGLIVPVIRNADQLSLTGIARALRTLADQIRTNRFAIEDLRGGTFTITNVGALGGGVNTPIINYPEVAILGLGRSRKVPVLRNGELAEVLHLPLNLSFDHRAADGAGAARLVREIVGYLENPETFLLD